MVKPRRISDFKPTFTNLAQTSHYQVMFAGLPLLLRQHLRVRGLSGRFVSETAGLLCNSAVLPGSRLATADIIGNHMGVSEKMAHSRIFTQIQLEFYVDSEYNTLKFLEHWMEFIANGSTSRVNRQSNKDYYVRMEYPHDYKCDETKIFKFDRDYNKEIEYKFIGLFPIDLTSTQVRYEQSEVLKATATFSFDRYICGESSSLARSLGIDLNNNATLSATARNNAYKNNTTELNRVLNNGLSLLNDGTGFTGSLEGPTGRIRGFDTSSASTLSGNVLGQSVYQSDS